jgi:hypothetical protein
MHTKFLLLIILMLSTFNVYSEDKESHKEVYWYVSHSDGDDINTSSNGMGLKGNGYGLEIVLFRNELGYGYANYRVPHNNYWILSTKDGTGYKQQSKIGLDLKKYIDIADTGLSLTLGLGGYAWSRHKIAQSSLSYDLYLQDSKSEYELTGLIGVNYIFNDYLIGVESHTLRGTVLSIGSRF